MYIHRIYTTLAHIRKRGTQKWHFENVIKQNKNQAVKVNALFIFFMPDSFYEK
jgi:hypothetical protein